MINFNKNCPPSSSSLFGINNQGFIIMSYDYAVYDILLYFHLIIILNYHTLLTHML